MLLNITPDHLDRHGGMDGYIAAKKRIFEAQKPPRLAIVGIDDPVCAGLCDTLRRDGLHRVWPISAKQPAPGGVYVDGGRLIDATGARPVTIMDLAPVARLPGAHNWQNAAAAAAAALGAGIAHEVIAAGIRNFPGLKHRQELVQTVDGVAFVNDSKATNANAAEKALLCYENIYWIAGGRAKEGGIESLQPLFPRIRHAFLIGEAADAFADTLEGQTPFTLYEDMETAIEEAGEMALAGTACRGATVLLSPACAPRSTCSRTSSSAATSLRTEVLRLVAKNAHATRSIVMTTPRTLTPHGYLSTVGRWWWTVDKWMLAGITLLIVIGVMLNLAAGPPAAEAKSAPTPSHFVRKQMMFLAPIVVVVMFSASRCCRRSRCGVSP